MIMNDNDIIYFELNNWFCGRDYPNDEPFKSWMSDDLHIKFNNEDWIKENKLCVVKTFVDMSCNFCITATREWVEKNCPKLLNEYKQFLRLPDEFGDVEGRFGTTFLDYCEANIGLEDREEDDI